MNSRNASISPCVKGCTSAALLLLLAACAPPRPPAPQPPPPVAAAEPPAVSAPAAPAPPPVSAKGPRRVQLGAPPAARSMAQVHRVAAERLVAAHPEETYLSKPPPILLAVPVLLIELKADGHVQRIQVLRYPSDRANHDTVQLAIDAVRRAAPFGEVKHLRQPWTFTESFLFDDRRRFKPRSLE